MHGLAVIHQRRHCLSMVIWRRDAFVTYLPIFWNGKRLNPRTSMSPFWMFNLLHCCRNLESILVNYSWLSNTKTRFEQTKMPRSNDGGLTLCYALRCLANNIQEPYRTLSLQAIDASITWWQGKPAPRASALRAPWSLSPNLQRTLKQFLRKWHLQVLAYQVPCHTPSFKTVFIKHAAVLDQLCNHKQAISQWSTEPSAICCCQHRSKYKKQPWTHQTPTGSRQVRFFMTCFQQTLPSLAVIAEGSLLNKVFPSKKGYQANLKFGLHQWTKRNGLPSIPSQDITGLAQLLWQQHNQEAILHHLRNLIWWCNLPYLPLWRQTSFVTQNFLLMPLLSSDRNYLHGPLHLWTRRPRTLHNRQLPCLIVDKTIWSVIPMGHIKRSPTSCRLHPGQEEESIPKWPSHHLICGLPFWAYAQHPG